MMDAPPSCVEQPIAQAVRRSLTLLLAGFFILAAFGKAWRPDDFVLVLDFLLPFSDRGVYLVLAIGIMAWEGWLGGAVLFWGRSAAVLWCVGATLVVFSAALVRLAVSPDAPSCGCLGLIQAAEASRFDAQLGLVRNTGLLGIVAWLAWASGIAAPRSEPSPPRPNVEGRRAFSLIEMLVVIGIVAVVIGITLPMLARSRAHARATRDIATQRSLYTSLTLYSGDYADAFPYFGTPGDPEGPIVIKGTLVKGQYFIVHRKHWISGIVPEYFDGGLDLVQTERSRVYLASVGYPSDILQTYFYLTATAFAAPEFFSGPEVLLQLGPSPHYRATRWHEMLFPSQKGILLDVFHGFFDPRTQGRGPAYATKGDGVAGPVEYFAYDPEKVVIRPYGTMGKQIMSTRDGLRGVDW